MVLSRLMNVRCRLVEAGSAKRKSHKCVLIPWREISEIQTAGGIMVSTYSASHGEQWWFVLFDVYDRVCKNIIRSASDTT
jgi:hypothetical protein